MEYLIKKKQPIKKAWKKIKLNYNQPDDFQQLNA